MQLISPEKIFRGKGAWLNAIAEIKKISKRPLILGRSLSGLIKRINKNVNVSSINSDEDIRLLLNDEFKK